MSERITILDENKIEEALDKGVHLTEGESAKLDMHKEDLTFDSMDLTRETRNKRSYENANADVSKYLLSLIDIKNMNEFYTNKINEASSYRERRFYERMRMRNLLDRGLRYPRLYSYDCIYGG